MENLITVLTKECFVVYGRDRLLFCFAVVQSLCTVRDGPLEIPVHEFFFQ